MARRTCLIIGLLLAWSAFAQAQTDTFVELFKGKLERLRNMQNRLATTTNAAEKAVLPQSIGLEAAEITPFLMSLLEQESYHSGLSKLEEERIDKQLGAPANSAGSTSVTSKGSTPALLAVAVEHGALTRDVTGNTVTFRGSPWNIIKTLSARSYQNAGPAVPPLDGSFEALAKRVSMHISFDTTRGQTAEAASTSTGTATVLTADRSQLSSWGTRIDLYNKRDPRHPDYRAAWTALMTTEGSAYINRLNTLVHQLTVAAMNGDPNAMRYVAWKDKLASDAQTTPDQDLTPRLRTALTEFRQIMEAITTENPQYALLIRQVALAAAEFGTERSNLIDRLMASWIATLEYNFTAQANTSGTVKAADGSDLPLPDLGSLTFIAEKGFTDGVELTFNAGWTWFQGIPTGLDVKGTRDVRASLDLSYGLPEIENIGKIVLSASGQFINLRKPPLGQKVTLLKHDFTQTGNIWLVQFKATLPAKGSGVRIPLAFTYSNRTELVPDVKEWRVNLGLLFDMDKLGVKP